MTDQRNPEKRRYNAPRRRAAAARTQETILHAAKRQFEQGGWAGTSIRAISQAAGVSQKTVEAIYGTKASVLEATIDYAIRGDVDPLPMPQREAIARMETTPHAATMLKLHAAHLRAINERSARLAWVVEHAAAADPAVAALWRQMNKNRQYGVRWAATTLLQKPDHKPGLTQKQIETTIWVALDWGTYLTLTEHAHLTPTQFETWLRQYYEATLLNRNNPR